ncbi:TIR domain-containing protein [Mycoplasmopsis primatum]|uniref:TIR domain-containing protein n=1 Tax=Mycoplasmopsis primatum TaxID=55604 RepID=UPI000494DDCB|nr:TIR domain-containing protein [Mycoplasmopsis primatum]
MKVCVLCGASKLPKTELEKYLYQWGIEHVISQNETNNGNHILNGVLNDFNKCNYSIALLANDDFITINNIGEESIAEKRARQNVILEIGMWIAKKGIDRLFLIKQKGTVIPSDLHGILYKEFSESIDEIEKDIFKQLKEAGFEIENNRG